MPFPSRKKQVAIELEYAKSMFDLHKKSHPNDEIVGWYATGSDVTEHSLLIHEYYSREATNPVHVTVDTTLKGSRMGIRAYQSCKMGVPGKTEGTIFSPIPCEVILTGPERVGVYELSIFCFSSASERLLEMLGTVVAYVDDVLDLLMIVYLSGLCKAQISLGEKLATVI
ncbi:hypothetical protein pdam_00023586 [Pocillopora damicornis]|uniref:MPN domain-containing protein n=1 Tax=Pocillopora damicornis TaxID=46731 RepID=A0A3M6UHM9_POCDA|nr:hypothetical protein pdam_00023586 [Pocillopora damicornis]